MINNIILASLLLILIIIIIVGIYFQKKNILVVFYLSVTAIYLIPYPLSIFLTGDNSCIKINTILIQYTLFLIITLSIGIFIKNPRTLYSENNYKFKFKTTYLFVITTLLIIYYFNYITNEFGGVKGYLEIRRSIRYDTQSTQGKYVLISQVAPTLLLFVYLYSKSKLEKKLSIIMILGFFIIFALAGERRIIFNTILVYIFSTISYDKLKLRRMIPLVAVIILIMSVIGVYRNFIGQLIRGNDINYDNIREGITNQVIISGENKYHYEINNKVQETKAPLLLGQSYANVFIFILPRFIIENRPDSFGKYYIKKYESRVVDQAEYGSSLLAEGTANFGVFFGALSASTIAIILMVMAVNMPKKFQRVIPNRFTFAIFTPIILILFRSDSNVLTKTFLFNSILPLIIIYILMSLNYAKINR